MDKHESAKQHLHKKRKFRKVLIIIGVIVGIFLLALGVLWYQIEQEIHPRKFSKFKQSDHYVSSSPAYKETISTPGEISIRFNYPLTKLTTVSLTAGDWEDSIGNNVYSADMKTVSKRLKPTARDAIYTVNYTACFINNFCDYGYFQFRLKGTPKK
jgi:hypothetical protein